VAHTITSWIGDYGVYAVFLLMAIDAVFPAASELVMLYAGVLAVGAVSGHHVTVFGAEIDSTAPAYATIAGAGVLGYTLGSVAGWAIGMYGGRTLVERYGRWLHVTPENLDRAERWFDRYGDATVFLGRDVPVVRSFISIPAGLAEMPLPRYTLLTFLGTIPWCYGLAGAGVALGSGWERFHERWRYADYAVAALVVGAIAYVVWHALRRRGRRSLERSA
jgi:membrane protein DedA with SNARE-associated domain